MNTTSFSYKIKHVTRELIFDFPFYWALLSQIKFTINYDTKTLYLTQKDYGLYIVINPIFFALQSREHQKSLLIHELNHYVLGHLNFRPKCSQDHQLAWMIACDVTANEYIPFELPPNSLTCDMFGLPKGESTCTRYYKLIEMENLSDVCPNSSCDIGTHEAPKNLQNQEFLFVPLSTAVQKGCQFRDQHMHTLCNKAIQYTTANYDYNSPFEEKIFGCYREFHPDILEPSMLSVFADSEPTISWSQLIKSKILRLQQTQYSKKHLPRRLPHLLGYIPGSKRVQDRVKIVVAIDTSGSMSTSEFQAIISELRALARLNTSIDCVQCDTSIVHQQKITPNTKIDEIHGRGGTDLRPPFHYAEKGKYDLMIYFTDGCGPAPETKPKRMNVLWVLTEKGASNPSSFGKTVYL